MFTSNRYSMKRRGSRTAIKQRQQAIRDDTRPGLSLDTNFSRHIAAPPQQVFPNETQSQTLTGDRGLSSTAAASQPKQVRRLKPSRLNLDGVSPFDRLISIGIAVPKTSNAGTTQQLSSSNEDLKTPMIIITPAQEDFDLSASPGSTATTVKWRAASSVYSRYADFMSKSAGGTPPVPALPFLLPKRNGRQARNDQTLVTDSHVRQAQAASMCTVFEEDTTPASGQRSALPTSRRSKGWWNYITSPFSARSSAFPWRSPHLEDSDQTPILHRTLRELPRGLTFDDEELHSAPPSQRGLINLDAQPKAPLRSMTAPCALGSQPDAVDIYRIPSQGEAAPYFDLNRHFPSLIISPGELPRSTFENDTPTTGRGSFMRSGNPFLEESLPYPARSDSEKPTIVAMPEKPHVSPSTDASEKSRALFSSPSAEELSTPIPVPRMPGNRGTQTTGTSQMSPLSPSPILGQAHIAHVVGPACAEQKEIPPAYTPVAQGLGFATMAARSNSDQDGQRTLFGTPQHRPSNHSRSSSHGLGISNSNRELFPPPSTLSEKLDVEDAAITSSPRWYQRYLWILLALCTALLTLMVVMLVMHIPQSHSDMPVQAQWVNLTGYPPIPTGVSTIAQPKTVRADPGCVNSSSLWSCEASAEQQTSGEATSSGSPNFRFEIRFNNDTSLNSSSLQIQQRKRSNGPRFAGSIVRRAALLARSSWSDLLFTPQPSPPSTADQIFLGNFTDNNTEPYNGEATPFYISLLDAAPLNSSSSLTKRQSSVYPYPTADNSSTTGPQSMPKPLLNDDGTPFAATLYPLAEAQPLRLYKRGQSDEHYGFYTYFDRTLYVANSSNGSIISNTPLSNATAVCTWSQSRFLVQVWTRGWATSLPSTNSSANNIAANSTANDLTFPGSFPYDATITIDRHGGDASEKGAYCYGIGTSERVEESVSTWIDEDRAYGGTLINAAVVPGSSAQTLSRRDDSTYGGIDGGTGGCACAWQNW